MMEEPAGKIRAFIAVSLPEEIQKSLHRLQKKISDSGINASFPKPEILHLTLKFLGDSSRTDLEKISACMEKAVTAIPVHRLWVSSIGVFPSIKQVRIIWAGITGRTHFVELLAKQLDTLLFHEMNIPKETKLFRPHLTLARVKGKMAPAKAMHMIKEWGDFSTPEFTVSGIGLYQSELFSTGAVHTRIAFTPFSS